MSCATAMTGSVPPLCERGYYSEARKHDSNIPWSIFWQRRDQFLSMGGVLRVKTSRASLGEEGEWVYRTIRPLFPKRNTFSHGRCDCAAMTGNCCQTEAGYSGTQKAGLTFQLYASDGLTAGSDEGIPASGAGKISEELIFWEKQISELHYFSGLSPLYQTVPISPSAHSCSNRIKTLLDPPMSKSHPQGRDFFSIGCGRGQKK